MKKFSLIIVLFIAIYSLTSCASNRGHGCGYWSATEIPQQEERACQLTSTTELICTEAITVE